MIKFEVGQRSPVPLVEGMKVVLDPHDEGLAATLFVGVPSITPPEIRALTKGPVRLAIVPDEVIAWVVLDSRPLSLDAPYALGLVGEERARAVLAGLRACISWPETRRGMLDLVIGDAATGIVCGLRAVTMSRAWWMALGTAIGECPVDLSPGALQVAIQAGYRRWPDVAAMLKCAVAVEAVGKV